jgi:hypothetical protein
LAQDSWRKTGAARVLTRAIIERNAHRMGRPDATLENGQKR